MLDVILTFKKHKNGSQLELRADDWVYGTLDLFVCWNWGLTQALSSFLQYFHVFLFQKLEGISDIRDESDRSGMRIVIEV